MGCGCGVIDWRLLWYSCVAIKCNPAEFSEWLDVMREFMVLYQPSAKRAVVPTDCQMLYSFTECKKTFGSPYQVERAVRDGRLFRMGAGVYSDTGEENELQVVQWRHPHAVMTLDSAYFYYDLTDEIPDAYYMATDRKARPMNDPLVRQFYMPAGTFELGITRIDYCGNAIRTYDLERLLIETARMKGRLDPALYKEVILSFRRKADSLLSHRLSDYLQHFAKRDMIESIIYEEVF